MVDWKPAVMLDLDDVSGRAFQEALAEFREWSEQQGPPGPLPKALHEGWCDITPELAENLLRRNKLNRKVSLEAVRKYARRMKAGEWRKTGQPALICNGELYDAQHRCWAGYFSGVTFPCYLITSVPEQDDLFAFIDDMKPRTAADTLLTGGSNGISTTISSVIKIAFRYEHGALGILTQPAIRPLDNIEILAYARQHPDLATACHDALSNFSRAVATIGHKGVAGFVAWKIMSLYDRRTLEDFYLPLGSGANLEEDDAVLALRNRLMRNAEGSGDDLKVLQKLALVIKGFNMYIRKAPVKGKNGLFVRDNERYPLFEDALPRAEAAE